MQEPVVQAMSSPEPEPEPEPEYHVHQNYMAASDGFFRPDEPLRRADCAQLLYNLTQDAPRSAEPAQYDDVLPEYWYYEAVSTMGGYLPQEEGQTCFFPSASVMPDTFLTALLSALGQTEQSAPPALLQAAQALMPDGAQGEEVPAPAPITRAQAAVLVNRALGREPDTEAINGVHRSLLLDVPEDRADYADLVEAVLPHDYYLDDADEQEHYRADALDALSFTPGIHLSGTSGFFVDADGRVVRGTGFLDEQNRRYYRCDETGRILADYAPHYLEGHAVFVRADGILRRNGVFGEYLYDENGFYTTGNTELDAKLDDFIAACTTEDMTQEECLHACMPAMRLSGRCGIWAGTRPMARRSKRSLTTNSWNLPTRSFRPARATAITSPPCSVCLHESLAIWPHPLSANAATAGTGIPSHTAGLRSNWTARLSSSTRKSKTITCAPASATRRTAPGR